MMFAGFKFGMSRFEVALNSSTTIIFTVEIVKNVKITNVRFMEMECFVVGVKVIIGLQE